jgi:N-acetylglucosaminyldiphosphoundecaprenol N-acetyl-beta-D-mannosaminyltransferase
VDMVNAAGADIVWVGLGAPKQEKWMASHVRRVHATAMIGVGAAFDFHSGRKRWCPGPVRSAGLEWAYRLACEPGRLWRRNLDSPVFLSLAAGERLSTGFRSAMNRAQVIGRERWSELHNLFGH